MMDKPKAVSLLGACWIHMQMIWRASLYARMLKEPSSIYFYNFLTRRLTRKGYHTNTIMHGMITPKNCFGDRQNKVVECLAREGSDWYYCWHLKGKCPWRR